MSDTGNKKYAEIRPVSLLDPYVKFFWCYEHYDDDFEYIVLPDACFDLLVDFENGILQNVYLTGFWTKPKRITVTKGTTLLAVRFRFLAAELFFQKKIGDLLDDMTILPVSFWSIDGISNNGFARFTQLLTDHLCVLVSNAGDVDRRKLLLSDLICNERIFRVNELARRLFWSSRQINRYFNTQFGMPLKQFLNIVRCADSYGEIVSGNLYPSADHADQAHFIREVKKYTGNTPRQLHKNNNDRFIQLTYLKKE